MLLCLFNTPICVIIISSAICTILRSMLDFYYKEVYIMNKLLKIYGAILRILTGFMPNKRLRRYIRNNYIYSQVCPKGLNFYLVRNGKRKKVNFIKFGLSVHVFGDNNEIIIDSTAEFAKANIVIRGEGNKLFVGANSSLNNAKIHLYGKHKTISIGEDCLFSYDIEIWNGDGHSIFINNSTLPYNVDSDITIGNHVWAGAYSKILKGAFISDDTVIGMSSLVNKPFEESNVILSGLPAKVVKRNITWDSKAPIEFV